MLRTIHGSSGHYNIPCYGRCPNGKVVALSLGFESNAFFSLKGTEVDVLAYEPRHLPRKNPRQTYFKSNQKAA